MLRLGREVLLTLSAALGLMCLLLIGLGFAFGIHPLLFRSGSMSPTIDTGDIAFAKTIEASRVHRGDIVSLVAPSGERVTHRVVSNSGSGDHRKLILKGDANKIADPDAYDATSVQKVFLHVPKIGYAVNWLSQAPGVYLLAAYVALMLLLIGRRQDPSDRNRGSGDSGAGSPMTLAESAEESKAARGLAVSAKSRRTGVLVVTGAAALITSSVLVGVSTWSMPTWAAWTDAAPVAGQTLRTGTWGRPPAPQIVSGSCTTTNGSKPYVFDITWSGPTSNPDSFILRYSNPTLHPDQTLLASARKNITTYDINAESGSFWVVAIVGGVESPASNTASYQSQGGSKICVVSP